MLEFGGKKLSTHFGERPPEFSSKDFFVMEDSAGNMMTQSVPIKLNAGLISAGLVRNSMPPKLGEKLGEVNTTHQLERATSEPNQTMSEELPEIDSERDAIYFATKFDTFINLEEKDEQFSAWENFYNDKYSREYLESIAWEHSPGRKSKTRANYELPEQPARMIVPSKRMFRGGSSFQEVSPYDDEIFDNYHNYFSRNYDSKKKKNFISKQAGNIMSFFK